jgi:formate dehydrogenase subunit gamma
MIRRHSTSAMAMHWFNAGCWVLLTGSGFGMLANSAMQPIGEWWPRLWTGLLGSGGLLDLHVWLGLAWLAAYAAYCLLRLKREVLPFLREIFRLSLRSDLEWCLRKGLRLVLGESSMRSLGLDPRLPPQGFYNAGQKLFAVAAVASGAGLAATGVLLAVSRNLTGVEPLVQWALLAHLVCAGIAAVALPVHVYMAAFAPGEGPALRSMFTGFVPEAFVRHHNPLWHDELLRQGLGAEQKEG